MSAPYKSVRLGDHLLNSGKFADPPPPLLGLSLDASISGLREGTKSIYETESTAASKYSDTITQITEKIKNMSSITQTNKDDFFKAQRIIVFVF